MSGHNGYSTFNTGKCDQTVYLKRFSACTTASKFNFGVSCQPGRLGCVEAVLSVFRPIPQGTRAKVVVRGGLPRHSEAIPRTGVLFTEGGDVPQDHCHCKVGLNRADAAHGVCQCWELDLVVIHRVPSVRLPDREVAHVQHVAVCIFRCCRSCWCACVAAAGSGCAAAGVVSDVVCIGDGGGRNCRGGVADGPAWRVAILADGCITIVGSSTRSENRRIRNSCTAGASRCPLNVGSQQDGYF